MSLEREVKIILHGPLKKLYPEGLVLRGTTMAEIYTGLKKIIPELNPIAGRAPKLVQVLGFNTRDSFFSPLLPDFKEAHIVPAMTGGKGGGFMNVILGSVFIAAAFLLPPAIAGATLFASTTVGSALFSLGASLVLGGLLSFLSPAPSLDAGSTKEVEASKYLGAGQNTVKIGTRIPILYGRYKVYGHYLSFNVDAVDVAV